MQFFIKVVVKTGHIPQKRNQSKNDDIPQKHENLRFAHVIII